MPSAAAIRAPAPSRDRPSPGAVGRRYRLVVAGSLGVIVALAGGASRADEPQQMLVRLAALAAIAATLWPLRFDRLAEHRRWLLGLAAAFALLILQLVPLPPALWAALPGRALYADIARAAGVVVWRPLSLTPDLTLNALLGLLPASAMLLAALHLRSRDRHWLFAGAVAVAVASALLGLVQLALGGERLHLFRTTSEASAVGLFANRNHQAVLLACALPALGALAARWGDRRWAGPLAAGLAAVLLLGIAASGSRMGLVLGAAGLAGLGWALRRRIAAARWWLGPGAAACALLLWLVARDSGLAGRLADGVGADVRLALLGPMLSTAWAMAPFGGGFGSFDSLFRRFEPDSALSTIYMNHAHNEPLELAIEGGAPALLLLALFLAWWGATALRIVRAGQRRSGPMAGAAVTISALLMLSSLVDYPLRTPLLGTLFALACAEMLRSGAALARGNRQAGG